MNLLNNELNGFVDNGTDLSVVNEMEKSLGAEVLEKAMDKTKLVQKEIMVQTKHGVVRRKQWVKASEDQAKDKSSKVQGEPDDSHKPPKGGKTFGDMLGKDGDKVTKNGYEITRVSETKFMVKKPGDDEAKEFSERSAERIFNFLDGWENAKYDSDMGTMKDPKGYKPAEKKETPKPTPAPEPKVEDKKVEPKKVEKPKAEEKKEEKKKPEPKKSKPTNPNAGKTGKYFKGTDEAKAQVQDITKGMSSDQVAQFAKDHGITWAEHSHKGINCMRAKMAIAKAMTEGTWSDTPKVDTAEVKADGGKEKDNEKPSQKFSQKFKDEFIASVKEESEELGMDPMKYVEKRIKENKRLPKHVLEGWREIAKEAFGGESGKSTKGKSISSSKVKSIISDMYGGEITVHKINNVKGTLNGESVDAIEVQVKSENDSEKPYCYPIAIKDGKYYVNNDGDAESDDWDEFDSLDEAVERSTERFS